MARGAKGCPKELEEARGLFTQWRRKRRRGQRIPEELWVRATALATDLGVHRTAIALGLDYYSLKRRVAGKGGSRTASPPSRDRSAPPAFVEVQSPLAAPENEWVVEIEEPDGFKARVQYRGSAGPDLAALRGRRSTCSR